MSPLFSALAAASHAPAPRFGDRVASCAEPRATAGEIEHVLLAHPGVAEAAVTGAPDPDPDSGKRIIAWTVTWHGASPPSARELTEHVAGRSAAHERPRGARFRVSPPRDHVDDLLKRELV